MMHQVHAARNLMEAHFVRGLLDAEGIPAVVWGEHLTSLRGEVPMTPDTLPSVWIVDDADVDRAQVVVRAFLRGEVPEDAMGEPWHCPGCGEELEGQFTHCWQCGKAKHREGS